MTLFFQTINKKINSYWLNSSLPDLIDKMIINIVPTSINDWNSLFNDFIN